MTGTSDSAEKRTFIPKTHSVTAGIMSNGDFTQTPASPEPADEKVNPAYVNIVRIQETQKTARTCVICTAIVLVVGIIGWVIVRVILHIWWLELIIEIFGPTGIAVFWLTVYTQWKTGAINNAVARIEKASELERESRQRPS